MRLHKFTFDHCKITRLNLSYKAMPCYPWPLMA